MRSRCTNPNHMHYYRYGGAGINICDEWYNFDKFYFDMGPKPDETYTIDRINNSLGYYKDNCIWSSKTIQAINRRKQINNSGYTGVFYRKDRGNFQARIRINKKKITIGTFSTALEAHIAYEKAALDRLNKLKSN